MRIRVLKSSLAIAAILLVGLPCLAAQDQPAPGAAPAAEKGKGGEAEPPEERERPERPERPERGEDHIETDRDAFTPATRLVGKGLFILESSYSFTDNRSVAETHSFPETLLRYGLFERLELRLGWNYEVGGAGNDVSGTQTDLSATDGPHIVRNHHVLYGLKAAVTEQNRWIPASAFIAHATTPTGGEETATQYVGTYVFGWELPNRWKFDSALRYSTGSEAGDRFGIWIPSTVLRVPLDERWQVHAEYFGLFSQDKAENFSRHFASSGFHYLINSNLEVGARVGCGLNDQSARFFANAGIGWRF